jgi:hypothetical protein
MATKIVKKRNKARKPILIYRVEDADGQGIYCCCHVALHDCQDDTHHPAPWKDGIRKIDGKHFAFASLDQLKAWFSPEVRLRFASGDVYVSVYEIFKSHCKFGYRQLCFDKSKAKLVQRLDPNFFSPIPENALPKLRKPSKKGGGFKFLDYDATVFDLDMQVTKEYYSSLVFG